MRRLVLSILGVTASLLLPAMVLAATISWKAAVNGNWNDPTKWDKGTVPGVGDNAFITFDGTYTVTLNADAEVASLTLGGASGTQTFLANASKKLTLDGASTVNANGVYNLSNGTLTGSGALTVQGTMNFSGGTIDAAGTVTVPGILNWSGGTMSGAGTTDIAANGMLTMSTGVVMNRSINNAGTTTWSSGNVSQGNGSVFTNQDKGTLEIKGASVSWLFNNQGNPTTFVNQAGGTVSRTTSSSTAMFSAVPFNNAGKVSVDVGMLVLNGGGTSSKPFDVAAGARLDVNSNTYTLNMGAGQTGAGILRINGGTLTVAANINVVHLELMNGTLTGVGDLTIMSSCDWSGGTMSSTMNNMGLTIIPNGATLTMSTGVVMNRSINNAGTTTWSSGNVSQGNGSVFTNQDKGTLEIKGASVSWLFNNQGNPTTFVNQAGGTVSRTTSSSTAMFSAVPFNNAGKVSVDVGMLVLNGGGTSSTPFDVAAGARLDVNSNTYTLNMGAGQTGAGILRINGGTLTVAANINVVHLELLNGMLTGVGDLTIMSSCDWSGGTMSSTMNNMGLTIIPNGATLTMSTGVVMNRSINNAGTTTWSSGNVSQGNGSVFTNQDKGTLEIKGASVSWLFNNQGNPTQFVNQAGGTVSRTTSSSTATFSAVPFNNAGKVSVEFGMLVLNGGGMSSTPFDVAAGARLDVNSNTYTLNMGAGQTGAGILRINGGTLTVAANINVVHLELLNGMLTGVGDLTIMSSCDWSGGTMSSTMNNMGLTIIPNGATLTMSTGVVMNRSINNAGTTTWSSGNVSQGNGSVFTNQDKGTLEIKGASVSWLFNNQGNPTQFVNQAGGTVSRTTSSSTATFSAVPFNNAGKVSVEFGMLVLNGGGMSSTPFDVAAGARLDVNSNTYTLNMGAGQTGAGILRINGGTLTVAANINVVHLELLNGMLTGVGDLTIMSSCDWSGGTMSSTMNNMGLTIIPNGATLTMSTGVVMNRSINNAGTTTWSSGNVSQGNGAVFTNQDKGTVEIKGASVSWLFNNQGNPTQFVNQAGGTVSRTTSSSTATFSAVPFNNAGTVNATGVLSFSSAFTQTAGATHLSGGNLATTTTIDIQGGILDGTGTIAGNVNVSNGGQVNPGTSPGVITVNGGNKKYTQTAQGVLNVDLNGLTAGTQYDQISLTGAAMLAGTLNVSLGFTPTVGSTFTIIDNDVSDAVTGTFAGLTEGATLTANGAQLRISYAGGSGNDVVLTFMGGSAVTSTPGATQTPTVPATLTPTPTSTLTPTGAPTVTQSSTPATSSTPTPSSSSTPTSTPVLTSTETPVGTATVTPTSAPTGTGMPTVTETQTATSTATVAAATATQTPAETSTASPTATVTATVVLTATVTPTPGAGMVVLAGRVLSPGRGGLLSDHGQVAFGGAAVDLFVCLVRKPCLPMGQPVASTVTDPDGRFRIQVSADLVRGTLPVVLARISPTFVLRAPVLTIPVNQAAAAAHARQVADDTETVVDSISEAAMRLLDEVGFEDFSVAGVGSVVQAVKSANAAANFEELTPEQAVAQAQGTAASDPAVQMALSAGGCVGDCNGRGEVTVDEIIKGVNIALGNAGLDTCPQFDADGSGTVTINELIVAVNNALRGCSG